MNWRSEDTIYLVMWRSQRSGATLSILRKSTEGKDNWVAGLKFMGIKEEDIEIIPQGKAWMPDQSAKKPEHKRNNTSKKGKVTDNVVSIDAKRKAN